VFEIADGVFRSTVKTDAFELDEEAGGGTLVHVFRDDEVQAGVWCAPQGPGDPGFFEFERNETVLILEGSVEIAIEGGPVFELAAGDMASFRKGVRSAWRERPGFKKFWVAT
jgi:uncharacterized cupin superfamily protein